MRTVWRKIDRSEHVYVPRCSSCGRYPKELRTHWFFTGLYCLRCIQDKLYGGYKAVE